MTTKRPANMAAVVERQPHVFGWCFSWGAVDQHHDRCPGTYKRQDGSTAVCECPAHKETR